MSEASGAIFTLVSLQHMLMPAKGSGAALRLTRAKKGCDSDVGSSGFHAGAIAVYLLPVSSDALRTFMLRYLKVFIPNILERESKRKNAGLQPGKRLQSGKGIF